MVAWIANIGSPTLLNSAKIQSLANHREVTQIWLMFDEELISYDAFEVSAVLFV